VKGVGGVGSEGSEKSIFFFLRIRFFFPGRGEGSEKYIFFLKIFIWCPKLDLSRI